MNQEQRDSINQLALKKAKEFYEADKQLNVTQRSNLVGCFRNQMIAYPIVTLPVVIGMIAAPRYFVKPGNKQRVYQVLSGLTGVFLGQQLSNGISDAWNSSKLANDPSALECYNLLAQFPPQFGYRYYDNTSHHPDLAMKDPDTIDWTKELSFPMNLIFTKRPNANAPPQDQHLYKRPERQAEEWRQGFEHKAKNIQTLDPKVPSDRSPGATPPEGNSWDRIRQMNQPQPPSQPAYGEPSKQAQFDSMIDQARGGTYNTPLSEEQRKFDEMLERERSGHTQNELDKKW